MLSKPAEKEGLYGKRGKIRKNDGISRVVKRVHRGDRGEEVPVYLCDKAGAFGAGGVSVYRGNDEKILGRAA